MSVYTDNFNRANGAPGAPWTTVTSEGNNFTITSNQLTLSNVGADSAMYYDGVLANDQYAQIVMTTPQTDAQDAGSGLLVRVSTSTDEYYGFAATGAGTTVFKRTTGGGYQILKSDATAWANGDLARIEVSGSSITIKRNGATISALTVASDTSLTSGRAGIRFSSTTVSTPVLDDFEAGDLGSGPTAAQLAGVFDQALSGGIIIGRVDA